MHAVLVSMGTSGDVFPFIGLGIQLRARGHAVTLVANEQYQRFATQYDFHFAELVSDEETQKLMANAEVWHPFKSALAGARWARERIAQQYGVIRGAAQADDAVLVAYPPVFAAHLVHETLRCPLVSLVPMPWMIPSVEAPPVLSGILNLPNGLPRPLRGLYWRSLEEVTDWLIGRHVNRVRRSLGLKKIHRVARWAYSPHMTLAMFPEWYAAPQTDWPVNTHVIGFSMYDGALQSNLPDELLAFCRDGDPPVVFTFGTGMQHAQQLFHHAVEICRTRRLRGILLSNHAPQIPAALPSHIRHCSFAPFHQLLPHCAALVHHGGLGTTAQALAAGIPQLITPLAWDQHDNAARVKRLGAGDWCQPASPPARLVAQLDAVLTREICARCQEIAKRFQTPSADVLGTQLIEQMCRMRVHALQLWQ